MRVTSRILRYSATGLLLLLSVLGGFFAAGYAVSDLPVLPVTLGIVAWVAAAGGLGWLALRRPGPAVPWLLAVSVAVALTAVVDARMDLFDRTSTGPVVTVVILAAVVPLALLGLRRATEAGLMLLLIGLVQFLGSGLLSSTGNGEPAWGRLLAGSSGIVVVPVLLAAVLFLVAGRIDHDPVPFRPVPHGVRTAH